MIPTTFGVAFVVFALFHLAPGDPALVMMGVGGEMNQNSDGEARIDTFRREHGLDRSLPVQFFNYIGPFNLDRDGISLFSTPFTERVVEEVELESGVKIDEGLPLPIIYLPGTSDEDIATMDGMVAVVANDDAGEAEWQQASTGLVEFGKEALPAIFTALEALVFDVERGGPQIDRLGAILERSMDHKPVVAAEREAELGKGALIRHWFGHYYQNGGLRVTNTGENPWGGLITGDLGDEMQSKESVGSELWTRLKVTVPLSLISVFFSYLIALPLGIFSVRKQGTVLDGMLTVILFVLYSIPTFWAALMLILVFGATGLDWLPVLGLHDKDAASMGRAEWTWDLVLHSILPVATLTYGSFAYLSRQMRAGMLDVIRQDYIRTARAKGMSERVVIYKHALRNSMIPVITVIALGVPSIFGGAIITENVFGVNGIGQLLITALFANDIPMVMTITFIFAIMIVVFNLIADVLYGVLDPRIRYD